MASRLPFIAALLGLMVIGGVIRALPIASAPLWFDEADTWRSGIIDPTTSGWNAETGLYEPVAMDYGKFFRWQNHFETAPLTFLLARISTDITGSTDEWAMRLPSLIAGILCIPAAFWLGRVVRGDALGLITAALVAFDPSQVDQSQQGRMYTVLMLLLLLAVALTIKLVREPEPSKGEGEAPAEPSGAGRQPHVGDTGFTGGSAGASPSHVASTSHDRWLSPVWQWITLGALYGLLLWTTQFTVAVWVGVATGVVGLLGLGLVTGRAHPKAKQVIVGITCAFAVAVMLANVGIHHILHRMFSGEVGDRPDKPLGEIAREIVVSAKDLINLTPAGLLIYVLAAIGLGMLLRQCKTSVAILGGIALLNVVILFRFLRIHHFMDARYLFCILPAVYIGLGVFAVGFNIKWQRQAATAIIVLFIAAQAWQSTHLGGYYQQPDRYLFAKEIMRVRDQMKPGETASIYPGVGVILGQYYRLPQDPALFHGMYGPDHLPLKSPAVPAEFKAPATWVILAMYNHEDGKQQAARRDTLKRIAAHYGVQVSEADLDKHLKRDRVTTVQISKDGVRVESVGVDSD